MTRMNSFVSASALSKATRESSELARGRFEGSGRLRIWEIVGASHCSIVGTCLSLAELRKIARRTGFLGDETRYGDYHVHGLFVEKMHDENAVSRAVQKHLDAKYEGAIRKAKGLEGEDAFVAYWETAVDNGMVAGAYWALIGHPRLPASVETRIFGDIHMMSHICGATHRGDAREIADIRREKAEMARRLANVVAERNEEIARQRDEIARLGALVREAEPIAAECARLTREAQELSVAAGRDELMRELEALRAENAALHDDRERAERRYERLKERASRPAPQSREAPALAPSEIAIVAQTAEKDLSGSCLLYVGGRPRTVCRLQRLVAQRNGSLIHHDGGMEDSRAMLSELVKRADAVFFPVDCVSHRAVGEVKSLCESHGIPYCPLRSSSASAFERAIADLEPMSATHGAYGASAA
jgi:hypothetical protein